jgi:hypothetical protein
MTLFLLNSDILVKILMLLEPPDLVCMLTFPQIRNNDIIKHKFNHTPHTDYWEFIYLVYMSEIGQDKICPYSYELIHNFMTINVNITPLDAVCWWSMNLKDCKSSDLSRNKIVSILKDNIHCFPFNKETRLTYIIIIESLRYLHKSIYPVIGLIDTPDILNKSLAIHARRGDLEYIKKIIKHRNYLKNQKIDLSWNRNAMFRWAAKKGRTEIVKFLLDQPEVNPLAIDSYALIMAIRKGHYETFKLLLSDPRFDPCCHHYLPLREAIINYKKRYSMSILKHLIELEAYDKNDVVLSTLRFSFPDTPHQILWITYPIVFRVPIPCENIDCQCHGYFTS